MMRSVFRKQLMLPLVALLLIAVSGCAYGPNPYYGYGAQGGYSSPYGAYPQGGVYPSQPYQMYAPGQQQYIPQGSVVPQGVTPNYSGGSGGLTPIPNPNGASTGTSPSASSEINKSVPNPTNSNGSQYYGTQNDNFQPPINAMPIQPASLNAEPIREFNGQLRESNAGSLSNAPSSVYSPPPTATASGFAAGSPMSSAIDVNQPADGGFPPIPPVGAQDDPFTSAPPQPSINAAPPAMPATGLFENMSNIRSNKPISPVENETFAHDPQYRWLRGVVARDEPTGTWGVIYSDNPDQKDDYAGHLSLAQSPFLQGLQDGDVVEIQGEIDPVMKDPIGKPVYLISRLKTLTEAPQF